MAKSQRKAQNYFKAAGTTIKYSLYLFGAGVLFLSILMVYIAMILQDVNALTASMPESPLSLMLQEKIVTVAAIFFVSFLIFLGSAIAYLVILGQRFGGPMTGILIMIDEMIEGNYEAKRALRKNDELGPIADRLKVLAKTLRDKRK